MERIERLEEEKAGLAADIRDVLAEAKGSGFCVPTIRKILKLRKLDAQEREEAETVLSVYLVAMGMQMRSTWTMEKPHDGRATHIFDYLAALRNSPEELTKSTTVTASKASSCGFST